MSRRSFPGPARTRSIIQQFREDFGLTDPIVLDRNCRCSVQIFETAKRLIARNPRLFEKQIEPPGNRNSTCTVEGFDSEEDEADWLMADLRRDRANTVDRVGGRLRVLYRSHRVGRNLEERLICAGIPCRLAQGHALATTRSSAG